jgi:spermidine synthase
MRFKEGIVAILFAGAIFVGAALLFVVQPLFARQVLPMLGGSPQVWNTAMVFYQAALLAGYAYAHATTRWLPVRRQIFVHGLVLLVPLCVLPIAIPLGWRPPTASNPVPWLLLVLTVSVGLPFAVVSTTSPLLQRWFAASGHRWARDPYFLYSASNAGSMIGLLSYPFVLEPWLRLKQQSHWWAIGYTGLMVLVIACGAAVWKKVGVAAVPEPAATPARSSDNLTWKRRAHWVALAFVPSSLMLGVTTYLTTDIAAVPLLWVVPLAIYLLTFILVFARRPVLRHEWMVQALPWVVLPLVVMMGARIIKPVLLLATWHVVTLFVVGMVCHGQLAQDRPAAEHLTEFYLWMSVGGVLGGAFNALLAPLVFTMVQEYPIALAAACLLMPVARNTQNGRQSRLMDVALPLVVGVLAAYQLYFLFWIGVQNPIVLKTLYLGVPALLCFLFRKRPVRFGLAVGLVALANLSLPGERDRILHAERSFFGVHKVRMDVAEQFHYLSHGSTLHGLQATDPSRLNEPLSYYTRSGPSGQFLTMLNKTRPPRTVAVTGLGVGGLAAHALAGQRWTFYEIDPAVKRIATDPELFSYLSNCAAPSRIILGDARLSLAGSDQKYDLLVLDAYSSDTLPVHLITREALGVYLDRLEPHGLLLFNITNRHLDLRPVLAGLAAAADLVCLVQDDQSTTAQEAANGKRNSTWAVVARRAEDLGPLLADARWQRPEQRANVGVWTDDYSSIFRVFRWR